MRLTGNRTLADLKVGEKGIISQMLDETLSLKLLEMGCLPGSEVKMRSKAPFGGALSFRVCGYNLSIGKQEAQSILIQS